VTPRHGLPLNKAPKFFDSLVWWKFGDRTYGQMLDSTFEIADQLMTGNGWTVDKSIDEAVKQVFGSSLKPLPTHRKLLAERLAA
jgi:hypothetical protein